jgi:hypothetical protein
LTTPKLSEADRERVRYHLGYLNVEVAASVALGFPSTSQPFFLVEKAMDRLYPEAVGRVLRILAELDCIEDQMSAARTRLPAQQLGELKLRNTNEERTEEDLLDASYQRWAKRLADQLGVPINPFSERFRSGAYGVAGGGSTPVAPP